MKRNVRLVCGVLAAVLALVGASPAAAGRGGHDKKFQVEVLI